jgi:photosystem II stability/assembly factor-like uncharacterized protein
LDDGLIEAGGHDMWRSLLLGLLVVTLAGCASMGVAQAGGSDAVASVAPVPVLPRALAALDAQHLVVVGTDAGNASRGAIATSADGGQTWASRSLATPPLNGVALRGSTVLVTADCAQASGPGCAWSSTDGGVTFVDLTQIPRLVRPALSDADTGWLLTPPVPGQVSTLWQVTLPSGTWGQTSPWCLVSATPSAVGIVFTSPTDDWMACSGELTAGRKARTLARISGPDQAQDTVASVGVPGRSDTLPATGTLAGLSMLEDGNGWLWTQDSLYASTDGGRTWTSVPVADGIVGQILSAQFVAPNLGFAVLSGSPAAHIARTADGGRTWTTVGTFPA